MHFRQQWTGTCIPSLWITAPTKATYFFTIAMTASFLRKYCSHRPSFIDPNRSSNWCEAWRYRNTSESFSSCLAGIWKFGPSALCREWYQPISDSSEFRILEKRNHPTIFPKKSRQFTYNKETEVVENSDHLHPEEPWRWKKHLGAQRYIFWPQPFCNQQMAE